MEIIVVNYVFTLVWTSQNSYIQLHKCYTLSKFLSSLKIGMYVVILRCFMEWQDYENKIQYRTLLKIYFPFLYIIWGKNGLFEYSISFVYMPPPSPSGCYALGGQTWWLSRLSGRAAALLNMYYEKKWCLCWYYSERHRSNLHRLLWQYLGKKLGRKGEDLLEGGIFRELTYTVHTMLK